MVAAAGMKAILRFAYTNAEDAARIVLDMRGYFECTIDNGKERCPKPAEHEIEPELSQIEEHIDHLGADVFQHDAILLVQAGSKMQILEIGMDAR